MIRIEVTNCGDGWVSDELKAEFPEWKVYTPVLIHAPTGRGKNQFIIDHLIPFAATRNKKVLLISNRYALNMQQRKQVWDAVGEYPLPQYALEKRIRLGHVLVVTYQTLATSNLTSLLEGVGYVVFDEAHFFLSDAPFNPCTTNLLQELILLASGAVRIYMSATPEDILPVVRSAEGQGILQNHVDVTKFFAYLHIYQFAPDYTRYKFSFFNEWAEITRLIFEGSPTEKWLIFVDTIDEGQTLKSELAKRLKKKVAFVDASTRKHKETNSDFVAYQTIQQRELFEEQVLISTPVLDNGINIKDPELKHIVIHSVDRTEVIQMMGRKRLDPGEMLTVHFMLLNDLEEVNSKMSSVKRLLDCLQTFRNNNRGFWNKCWGKLTDEMQQLFQVSPLHYPPTILPEYTYKSPVPDIELKPVGSSCTITINLLGEHKLNLTLASLEELQRLWYQHEGNTMPQLIYRWFQVEQILEAAQGITTKKEDALDSFRRWILEKGKTLPALNKEDTSLFYEEFLEQAQGLYTYKLRGNDKICGSDGICDSDEVRSNDDDENLGRKKADINNILDELLIPLNLYKVKKAWRLNPKGTK